MPPDSESRRRRGRSLAFRLSTSDDWRALLRTRANVLVSGPQRALTAFIHAAHDEMREPIRSVNGSTLSLCEGCTLILLEVDALDGAGQRQLIQWMNEPRNAETQIISLATIPLAPLVQTHRFDAELYYRLNVIYLEVLDSASRLN
jgi:hypothetical protein